MIEAHHAQTALLTQEASGDPVALSLLMVHGQNHLITAITFKDMANEIIAVYSDLGCQTFRIDDASWL
ncbi:PTS lactose/cellobiose transporter subunit IIA [Ruoffia tabacinasalis]|uniref:PTS lactose/cellobiose transporter subunit IIA n=1 Tax=Ruoffia tabacinasalis TaxID=87458 RepID=A0A5R9DTS6_9LACT|nr:PTS lactose/cellobiose transporter subunit IIA [Ruoffia tabacinasalis]